MQKGNREVSTEFCICVHNNLKSIILDVYLSALAISRHPAIYICQLLANVGLRELVLLSFLACSLALSLAACAGQAGPAGFVERLGELARETAARE